MAPLRNGRYTLLLGESTDPDFLPGGLYATARAPPPKLPSSLHLRVSRVRCGMSLLKRRKGMIINADDDLTYLHNDVNEPEAPLILSEKKSFKAQHEKDVGPIGIYRSAHHHIYMYAWVLNATVILSFRLTYTLSELPDMLGETRRAKWHYSLSPSFRIFLIQFGHSVPCTESKLPLGGSGRCILNQFE
ncbi:unnamed protein product [Rhizoctonia solani]|uniref:Uncharacterized protein n=1 Tax=Rhizoctonia solani TaxID=456999 RepID=A0A8H3EC64_9AGAM|nr:unnamed protein product [Rhizoctonia solani]